MEKNITLMENNTSPSAETPSARLLVLCGKTDCPDYQISRNGLRIGRLEDNEVILLDPIASRHHARIEFEAGEWWLLDLDSANGTYINNLPVSRQVLRAGDHITIGQEKFEFRPD